MSAGFKYHEADSEKSHHSATLQDALSQLAEGSPERQAIDAGEIDAVVDYSHSNVILFPAARLALREHAQRHAVVRRALADNHMLAALPRAEYRRLIVGLEAVELRFGNVLHEPGKVIDHVYFPIDSAVCLMTTAEDQRAVEVGLVGYEGMVGISLALDTDVSSIRALTIAAGTALRMEAMCFQEALRHCPQFRRELRRYACIMLALARKAVGCNCFHTVEARLARWLLMASDRVRSQEFYLTQASLAGMLGVRRCTVTETAGDLQRRGLIRYTRGNIGILDRQGLEGTACPCYASIQVLHQSVSRQKL